MDTLDSSLQHREQVITNLKHNLCKAHNRMKQMADKKISERTFAVGEWVYLRLQPFRQTSVAMRQAPKLAAKFFGPYQITKKVGMVAYSLKLSQDSRIHNTFHVSGLTKHHGPIPTVMDDTLPSSLSFDNTYVKNPEAVLKIRTIKKRNAPVVQWLIRWEHQPV